MYKFHINALYVAVTRAVENLCIIEANPGQRLFEVLSLKRWEERLALADHGSSLDEWRQEARRLELQGKQEQADAIRTQILKLKDVPWQVLHGETLRTLERQAFESDDKQAKLLLFEYALVYQDRTRMQALAARGFRPATQPDKGIKPLTQKYFFPYELKKPEAMLRQVDQYGVDFRNPFNQTPLMIAARLGNDEHVARLVAMGADTSLINNVGFNAFHIVLEQAYLHTLRWNDRPLQWPRGQSRDVDPWGMYHYRPGCNRYWCNGCKRTFNDLTHTLLPQSRRSLPPWILATFLLCLSCSARRIARELGVPRRTSYRWCWWLRHTAISYEMERP